MKNINDLRTFLFDAMQDVRNKKLDASEAKSLCDMAQTIVNSAKVEVDFMRVTGTTNDSGFISAADSGPDALPDGVVRVVRHRIAG